MATGDRIDLIDPKSLIPINGIFNEVPLVLSGVFAGVPLPKSDTVGYVFESRIPTTGTPLSTGLTFSIPVVDDPGNPDVGKVVRLGITVKRLVGGTSDYSLASAATEVFATVTTNATAGVIVLSSVAIANAALPASLAAGDRFLVQIRRNGTNVADTHQGRVLLGKITVSDT
jgi:hypothetical protein